MRKDILVFGFLLAFLLIFVGCSDAGNNSDVEGDGSDATVIVDDTGDGDVEVVVDTGNGENVVVNTDGSDDWCAEGSYSASGAEGSVDMEILGVESSGEFAGMCHMRQRVQSGEDNSEIDYYYDEDGNGYQIMNINGEEMKVAWSNN